MAVDISITYNGEAVRVKDYKYLAESLNERGRMYKQKFYSGGLNVHVASVDNKPIFGHFAGHGARANGLPSVFHTSEAIWGACYLMVDFSGVDLKLVDLIDLSIYWQAEHLKDPADNQKRMRWELVTWTVVLVQHLLDNGTPYKAFMNVVDSFMAFDEVYERDRGIIATWNEYEPQFGFQPYEGR